MFCTKCGKELFDEAVMCPQCGTMTANFQASVQVSAQAPVIQEEQIPSRNPDVKILYHVGEIGEKFPLKLNVEFGDFYFEDDYLLIESFTSAARVKTGTVKVNYSNISVKKLVSKQMMINKFKVMVFNADGFVFSVYALDGFVAKQMDSVMSSASQGSMAEFNATISKFEKIENLLNVKSGGIL